MNELQELLLVIGTLFALSSLGFDLTALSVLGGALGVGIGFGCGLELGLGAWCHCAWLNFVWPSLD